MDADRCVPLTASGAAGLRRLTAWHFKCTADAVVNIRKDSAAGAIIVPLVLTAGICLGDNYASPLVSNDWYLEIVSGTVIASICGAT